MNLSRVSILIIGNWNPRIFTPAWIKSNLFSLKSTDEIEALVDFENMEVAFQHDNIKLSPKRNSLEIWTESLDDSRCKKIGFVVSRIMELLPQTPIKALGVNIRVNVGINEKFTFSDIIVKNKDEIKGYSFNQLRFTKKEDQYINNLVIDRYNEKISVNFNFHYEGGNVTHFNCNSIVTHLETVKSILDNGNP